MATPRRSDRPGLLLWLNTAARLRNRLLTLEAAGEEMTVRPEDTLRAAASAIADRRGTSGGCRAFWRESVMAATQTPRARRGRLIVR
jgi:hypothetical protein